MDKQKIAYFYEVKLCLFRVKNIKKGQKGNHFKQIMFLKCLAHKLVLFRSSTYFYVFQKSLFSKSTIYHISLAFLESCKSRIRRLCQQFHLLSNYALKTTSCQKLKKHVWNCKREKMRQVKCERLN